MSLDKFTAKFVEEALDNVAIIEEALFNLESEPTNKEIIERLFRAMHTIKGGGAMFGFNDLSAFTHNLETIYDLVRNDKLAIDSDIISLTFESLDYIRQLLDIGDLTDPEDIAKQNDYIARIQKYFGNNVTSAPSAKPMPAAPAAPIAPASNKKNYLVSFEPFESLLNNGTNPFFIIEDLVALGDAKVVAYTDGVKSFDEFEPLALRIKWQTILSTESDENDIKDVFIFVEDECKINIDILPDGDVLSQTETLATLIETKKAQNQVLVKEDFAQFKQEVKSVEKKKESAPKAQAGGVSEKIATMRVASAKIDELVNAVSELVTMQAQFSLIATKKNDATLMAVAEQMEKITRQLRDNSFEISLIPLQGELVRFQRLVRDLSKNLGKQIDFVVEGGEIELDKNIIEHLTDPLLHMIRNSCDHGIEMPDERISKGKNPKGTIKLKAFYSGSSVIIRVGDDGKGMDPDKLFKKAVEKGLVDANAKMSKRDILALIFASGFSTADKVSDVSGRGVGMDVVKSKIAEIRGDIAIDSEIDEGTTFTLDLPLTLSIIDGLLTKVNGEQFVVPLSNIERILSISEVQMSDSKLGKTFLYENERVMFVDLNDMFYQKEVDITKSKILLVNHGGKRVGLVVDMIVGEFQIVVKPLGKFMRKVDMISGASVMGDGSLSLIIDTTRLINAYNQQRYKK
jgi:two-component system chemotaxis sensor kinase CheA